MRNLLKFWNAELARNPVVWAPLACLIVSCAMNTHAGFMLGNGSIFIPTIMLAIAIMTAYCGTTGLEVAGVVAAQGVPCRLPDRRHCR